MGTYVYGGWTVPDGGGVPNPATAVTNLMDGVGPFLATTGARDTAKSNYIAYMNAKGLNGTTASLGMRAYIIDRAGFCFWRGDKWVWESTHDLLINDHWSGPVGIAPAPTVTPVLTSTVTLPGSGFRQLQVVSGVNVTADNGPAGARMFVTGTGISAGEGYLQAYAEWADNAQARYRQSLGKVWLVKASGTQTYRMDGLTEGTGTNAVAGDMMLQVVDLGPAD
jgi:hypothetical protein